MKHDAQNIPIEVTPPYLFYAREQETPSSILFWRISEKPEQVAQDLRACFGKIPTENVIHVQFEASNALQD